MKPPTARQKEVLDFIVWFRFKHGYSPSVREIGKGVGITSLRGVTVHLEALSKKGLLRLNRGVVRGLVPIAPGSAPTPGFFSIVSDGTAKGTKVYSPGGEDVSGVVTELVFSASGRLGEVSAKITVLAGANLLVAATDVLAPVAGTKDRAHSDSGNDKVE